MRTGFALQRFAVPLIVVAVVLLIFGLAGWRTPFFFFPFFPFLFFWLVWRPNRWGPRPDRRHEIVTPEKDDQIARLETQIATLTATQQRLQESLDWQARLLEQSAAKRTRKKAVNDPAA